jgi:transposase
MKAISTAQCSSVISLLNEGYSLHQIQNRVGLEKSTAGRISKEVLGDKENCRRGRPSKLSSYDQHSIIQQIRSERLDNAVQVTQFINSTVTTPVTLQTVRNVLKKSGFYSATKKKVPMLKKTHRQKRLEFAHYHENWTVENFKRVLWSDETNIN